MTDILPFKASIYNPQKVSNLSNVVCPPYDCISNEELEELYRKDNFNFVRILLAKRQRKENKVLDRYTNARKTFADWLKKNIIIDDNKEAIYFYQQEFVLEGERRQRLGFIALMRLKEVGKGSIYPHESTHKGPKDDRLALLKSVKANLSPIFTLFCDEERQINRIFDNYLAKLEPMIIVSDKEKGLHKLWRLDDVELEKRLRQYMQGKSIFIADGHHRYEVACEFRDVMLETRSKLAQTRSGSFNYIMTYFMDINSKGLAVLPIHRMLKKIPKDFLERLEEFFKIEKVSDRLQLSFLLKKAAPTESAFGLYSKGAFCLLRLKNGQLIDEFLEGDSYDYNHLDVVVLNKLIFKRLLCLNPSDITFILDEEEALRAVDKATYKALFFLSPARIEQIRTIALNNERMPPKSTYFYPKLLSGLLIYKF